MSIRCTCAKNDHSEQECGLVAVAFNEENERRRSGWIKARYYYCKKHVKMFLERDWRKPEDFTLLPGKKMPAFLAPEKPGQYTHDWEKQNSVTICDETGMYDLMRCTKCGKTHRRPGLSSAPLGGCTVPT